MNHHCMECLRALKYARWPFYTADCKDCEARALEDVKRHAPDQEESG